MTSHTPSYNPRKEWGPAPSREVPLATYTFDMVNGMASFPRVKVEVGAGVAAEVAGAVAEVEKSHR